MCACLVTRVVVVCVTPLLCLSHANKSQIYITVFIENSVTYETMCQLPDCLNIDDLELKEHGAHLMMGKNSRSLA